ncbi:uncharacterized protein EI97DRAFT_460274 [Westerdykella ornata]|uniref:C2 domain-containing protein n=1 Tax=Westerdykella ornata TaxID=318751 RepID=A0A6A6JE27_WESOR|nr:uncharacterized protein EI97DRAFT_460274 [Westerdykella ornata]KAF2274423.1 hypothetical protein EI97DRAFT_460274 [Westerdykella ornata]
MATKAASIGSFGKMHTAGIFSDMTVDGPNIGTLVVIMDRAKNLPNRRSMGKQDPYCAARLGKEAKKTTTDKRGGQTPRWDQELRFTVHDSPDYQSLKVSVFNDDKKTELIGETWVSLENVLLPGGGQSDGWHGLNCKGKYAGEIRIELTYYDTRPKAEKVVEKRRETARPENGSPAVGGPRDSTPVKRRPLPAGPAGAAPSPGGTPEHRGLQGAQSGPRAYQTPPQQHRTNEHTPAAQHRSHQTEIQPSRRPLQDGSSLNGAPVPGPHTPQHHQRTPQPVPDPYDASPNPSHQSSHNTPQYDRSGYDVSYAAPKPYETQTDPAPQQREQSHRAVLQDNYRSSQGRLPEHEVMPHSYSAPAVPTQHTDGYPNNHHSPQPAAHSYSQIPYQDAPIHVEPLRTSRSHDAGFGQSPGRDPYYAPNSYDPPNGFDPSMAYSRSPAGMQPTVEDDDEVPPPPPVHRSNAHTVTQPHHDRPPTYHSDAPSPLNINRYREEPQNGGYDSSNQQYYGTPPSAERRYTHPQSASRPVSRDVMVPSPLRGEVTMLPSSLVPGYDASREENGLVAYEPDVYQAAPSYGTPQRLRQQSEPNYAHPPQYETPPQHPPLSHQPLPMADAPDYYPHAAPEEPRHTSPVQDHLPLVKPRAVSPHESQSPNYRTSRTNLRSMPTRKSVSPRPPPSADSGERRLSGVPFDPDSFDVYNPSVASKKTQSSSNNIGNGADRSGAVEVNEKGQIVTFSGRVIDASDHLPLDSWAPEPEPKGTIKERPVRERPVLSGARDLDAARQREKEYRRDRLERERIRNAVDSIHADGGNGSPSNSSALVPSRHRFGDSVGGTSSSMNTSSAMVLHGTESTSPGSAGRNRLQKRSPRPASSYMASSSQSDIHMPNTNGYGSGPRHSANVRHSVAAAPPIPAKIPLEDGPPVEGDLAALSLELQSIDIGPASGGRARGTTRRRYGGGGY